MDNIGIGKYIKKLRLEQSMTQQELANKLNISFQAISKWETGETLPDISIILDLCDILNITADMLLNGGAILTKKRKLLAVSDVIAGFESIGNVKKYFGSSSTFYKGMVEGINKAMNFDLEESLEKYREVLYAEVLIQGMLYDNRVVNIDDVKSNFKNKKMIGEIEKYINRTKELV